MGALITAKENFHAVSLSGGKDSTCLLLLMIERGLPIDAVIWADTGMEFPEMYGHISKVDEHLYRERGLHITTLRSPKSFEYMMFDEPKQKPSTLENRARLGVPPYGNGWPGIKVRWCTGQLKTHQINKELTRLKGQHRLQQYVGIAADEAHRCKDLHYRKAAAAERKLEKANVNALYQKSLEENPGLSSNPLSRWQQKQAIKRQYAAARRAGQTAATVGQTTAHTAQSTKKAAKKSRQAADFARRHKKGLLIAAGLFLVVAFFLNCMSSCSVLVQGGMSGIASTTYPSTDEAMLGAEAAYAGMEAELQNYLDTYESTHSYDEYHFDLDEIGHDPYVLISILTAYHQGEWTLDEVQVTLDMLFEKQYILTERVVVETRHDSEGDPYSWYICYVTLENTDLSHLPVYIMGEDQLSMYAVYMATLGNRPDLFPQSQYPNASQKEDYLDYDVPPEALEDEQFAAMLEEAEKYLGYPYVWGGSSPSTSFDCSGYVSWVLNHSGWDVGRLGAQGLCNICTPVTAANAKPGDLVFFKGTYDTPGVSHCGIYVGNGMMIHCGSPISYANLNTSYWQEHLYCYGRLP